MLDTGEVISFEFVDGAAANVAYAQSAVEGGAWDVRWAEAQLRAWGEGGTPLGTVEVLDLGPGVQAVSGLFCDVPIERFGLTSIHGDELRVQTVCYETAVPPCVGDLNGDGATDVLDFSIFSADFGCGTGP